MLFGVTYEDQNQDFTPLPAIYTVAVGMLNDGLTDAAFVGGAIPTSAVSQACTSMDVHFIPFEQSVIASLVDQYPFYQPISIPDGAYTDLKGEFQTLNVGSMHLITSADQPDDLIYLITKTIWENRGKIVKHITFGL